MLQEFKVKNFKNFKNWFTLDLTDTKNYNFNTECIENDIVSTAMIYGPNGCGKSNLGHAIFDVKTHLSEVKIDETYKNYLNGDSKEELAEFSFKFQFKENTLEYKYGKKSVNELVYEMLMINDIEVISFDRRKGNIATVNLKGAETLNKDLSNSNISVVKYVKSNTALEKDVYTDTFQQFVQFIEYMVLVKTVDSLKLISSSPSQISKIILNMNKENLSEFENFLTEAGIDCKLCTIDVEGEERIAIKGKNRNIDFYKSASTGTLSLTELYIHLYILKLEIENSKLKKINILPFVYIDEFDAFYHHSISKAIVSELKNSKCQAVFTTHNTSIMSNDLLRPDCYFIMSSKSIKPIYKFTQKELRSAHNIEKMYRAGAFNE